MRILPIIIVVFVFYACKNKSSIESTKEESIVVSSDQNVTEVPMLNFEQLQPMLNKTNDTTYVVNFWATWCRPCIKELPAFEKITEEFKDKPLKVLLVSLDFPEQLESHVLPFIKKRNLQSQVLLLNDTRAHIWIPKVDVTWSGAIPATLIYKNSESRFFEKSFSYETLKNEILKFI